MLRTIFILFFYLIAKQAFSQFNSKTSCGFLIYFRNRVAFFNEQQMVFEALLNGKQSKGLEVYQSGITDTLLPYSKKINIHYFEQNNQEIVRIDTQLYFVPVKLTYKKVSYPYNADTCQIVFYLKEEYKKLDFLCNDSGYEIEEVELLKYVSF